MISLIDNDVIEKLSFCDLWGDFASAYGIASQQYYVLPTAKFKYFVAKTPEKGIKKYSERVHKNIVRIINGAKDVEWVAKPDVSALMENRVGIDPGEAILFGAATQICGEDFTIYTGDKNSLRTLASVAECAVIHEQLIGHIVCFEQIVLKLIESKGFDIVKTLIVPNVQCDTALRCAFGSGVSTTEENAIATLSAYISELSKLQVNLLRQS